MTAETRGLQGNSAPADSVIGGLDYVLKGQRGSNDRN